MANKLNIEKRTQIVAMSCEGNSISSTCSVTGTSKNTIVKLLAEVGEACALYQDRAMIGLICKKVQCDEIWSFVGMKEEKNVSEEVKGVFGIGDVYTWTSIDTDTKLMPCWHVGTRGAASAHIFMSELASRMVSRIQLTTDGHKMYINAVESALGGDINYAMLVKQYGNEGAPIDGNPDMKHVSTRYLERANLTMHTNMRRFSRQKNAFSKKLENHMHAISLFHMHYNFCRIHKSLRVTPAMEVGLTDHVWDIEEVLMMVETVRKNIITKTDSN